jgi:hypothetical protein
MSGLGVFVGLIQSISEPQDHANRFCQRIDLSRNSSFGGHSNKVAAYYIFAHLAIDFEGRGEAFLVRAV